MKYVLFSLHIVRDVSETCPRHHQDILICISFIIFQLGLCRLQKSRGVLDVLATSWQKVIACLVSVTLA